MSGLPGAIVFARLSCADTLRKIAVSEQLLYLLTTLSAVATIPDMTAKLMLRERHPISEISFVELVIWRLPSHVPRSSHNFKYRLALVVEGVCVLRYDNEAGKGDHRHNGMIEIPYRFISAQVLLEDFWREVDNWRTGNE